MSKILLSSVDIQKDDVERVSEVLGSGWVMQGPMVEKFEKAVADFCQVSHAVAVSSGTSALHLALSVVGINPGDEVIVPSFSFIASANAIWHCGAVPVFCDVDERTYNMTPALAEKCVTSKTRAILVVHQFGLPCDMMGFESLAKKHHLQLVEDAACAIGSQYLGQPVGNGRFSDAACFSFHPRKIVTTGEGGMVLTNDPVIAQKVRCIRNHGLSGETFVERGYNYRLTDIQAALGVGQIQRLSETIACRRQMALEYTEQLKNDSRILLPEEPAGTKTNFQSYMIRLSDDLMGFRDKVAEILAENGIFTRKSIPPIHLQPCYQGGGALHGLKQTEKLAKSGLVLPFHAKLISKDIELICSVLKKTLSACKK